MQRRTEKRAAKRQPLEVGSPRDGSPAHVIRIASESDQEQALVVFRSIREVVHCIAEDEFLVTGEQLAALRTAGIPFTDVTGNVDKNGKAAAG
jgi:hypothetical protein